MELINGKVIFQKLSQPVQPSILAASYMLGGMVCKPDRKMMIWIPEDIAMSYTCPTISITYWKNVLPVSPDSRIFSSVWVITAALFSSFMASETLASSWLFDSTPRNTPADRITGRK